MNNYLIRYLNYDDYYNGFISLIEQFKEEKLYISYEEFKNKLDEINNNINHFIFVIIYNNNVIGSGTLFIENKFINQCGKVGHIEDIIIDKKYRGKSLGKVLLQKLIDEAKNNNCYKVVLNCDEKLINFYQKNNFKIKYTQMAIYF
jgi:glucosamine-phosphate N-acetyltransferase